mgnify:FL=1
MFQKPKASIIKASYRLMQKVGMGPIPASMVAECERFIQDNQIDFLPWALSCMRDLNDALLRSIAQGSELDDVLRQDMIAPIMQLKSSGAMFRNAPLTQIAASLLHFLESIPRLDQDVLDIVKANEAVLTAFLRDGQTEVLTPAKQQIILELQKACNRYAAKNGQPSLF